jgi:hypothetical protein
MRPSPSGEVVEDLQHRGEHREAHAKLDEQQSVVLAVGRVVVVEHGILQEVAAQHRGEHAHASVDEHADADELLDHRLGSNPEGRRQPEDQRVQDEGRGEDDPGLEATSWAIVTVKLHIQRQEEHVGDQHLGADPRDGRLAHSSPSSMAATVEGGAPSLRPLSSIITARAAVNTTKVSPRVS